MWQMRPCVVKNLEMGDYTRLSGYAQEEGEKSEKRKRGREGEEREREKEGEIKTEIEREKAQVNIHREAK